MILYLILFINCCCQFTAQVGNTNQGYGNNGNNAYNGNPNNANNQAIFHNDANTQVGQQFGSPNNFNNHPDGKHLIIIMAFCLKVHIIAYISCTTKNFFLSFLHIFISKLGWPHVCQSNLS